MKSWFLQRGYTENNFKDNLSILHMNHKAKPGPMVSFRSARKISSYLVRAELYP